MILYKKYTLADIINFPKCVNNFSLITNIDTTQLIELFYISVANKSRLEIDITNYTNFFTEVIDNLALFDDFVNDENLQSKLPIISEYFTEKDIAVKEQILEFIEEKKQIAESWEELKNDILNLQLSSASKIQKIKLDKSIANSNINSLKRNINNILTNPFCKMPLSVRQKLVQFNNNITPIQENTTNLVNKHKELLIDRLDVYNTFNNYINIELGV